MIVCDGFIGNVALKVSEGVVDMFKQMLQESLEATITRKIGYAAFAERLHRFQEARGLFRIRRRAAAGRKGVCIICHGRSNANAIKNAIRVAAEFSSGNINGRIEDELQGVVV